MEGVLVSVSTGAMNSLLRKLATIMSDEYNLVKDVRKNIKFLNDELEAMHAFLQAMADVEEPDELAKLRVRVVRELSYDIEDNIDKFMVLTDHEPSSKKHGFKKLIDKIKNFINETKANYQIAKEVKDIKNQVIGVSERYARYKIDEHSSTLTNIMVDPRVIAVFKDTSELVGIDGPRDELVKWLNVQGESSPQLKVVSIVGFGGLGKTTLARQVYETLRASFDCYAFVSISRNPDMNKILDSLLSQIRNKESSNIISGDQQITIGKIREFLRDKRYLIIVDDVWDVPTWRFLECIFVENNYGSIIMTTTRINDVANSCCSSHENLLHRIKPLNVADSKKLFFKRIFGCEERCPSDLREASDEILKRCGGLPLAINAVSSLLATRQTKDQWDMVRRSICLSFDKNSEVGGMRRILSLSYFELPYYLRSCLLYVTLFLEDSVIKRETLVHRWIAEGFIQAEDGQDLVEVGENYFHDLVNRSLILPVEIGFDGKAHACRVHDTIHDFLTYRSREDNFCHFVTNHSNHSHFPVAKVRRLSIMANNEGDVNITLNQNVSHIRTLVIFSAKRLPPLMDFCALRVLSLSGCHELGNSAVVTIGSLFQLRYLDISGTGISELPNEIGGLKHLGLLNTTSSCLYKLPETCTQLKRLARLFVFFGTKLPDRIGKMKNLQELEWINVYQYSLNFLQELGELTDLRKLSIIWRTADIYGDKASYKEKLVKSLCKLDASKLHTLRIKFYFGKDEDLAGDPFCPALNSIRQIFLHTLSSCMVSTWLMSLVNLEYLDITVKYVERRDLELIGKIPNLLEFRVSLTGSRQKEPIIIHTGFQQLQKFRFDSFTPGKVFMVEAGAMPLLESLELHVQLAPLELFDAFEQIFESAVNDFEFGIQHLSCLGSISLEINCDRIWPAYVEDVLGVFKSMVETHPNNPTLEITILYHDQDEDKATNNRLFPVKVPHLRSRFQENHN